MLTIRESGTPALVVGIFLAKTFGGCCGGQEIAQEVRFRFDMYADRAWNRARRRDEHDARGES